MKGEIALIIVIFITFKSVICKLPTEAVFHCYENNENLSENPSPKVNIRNITNVNDTEGTANVEFDYESNGSYKLKVISVSDSIPKEECEKIEYHMLAVPVTIYSQYEYSGKSIKDEGEDLPNCTKEGVIKLKYLRKGCFFLALQVDRSKPSRRPIYFTGPEKIKYSDQNLTFYIINDDQSSKTTLEITHPFINSNPDLNLKIDFSNNTRVAEWNFVPTLNEFDEIEYELYSNQDYEFIVNCEKIEIKFTCKIIGLDTGYYIFTYRLSNLIQCQWPNTWDGCSRESIEKYIQNAKDIPPSSSPAFPRESHLSSSLTWIIWGVIFLGIILIVLFAIYLKKKKGKIYEDPLKNNIKTNINTDKETLIKGKKILLLYPRDAEIVMKTMEAFRKALTAEQFQVYDVFDEDQQPSINQDINRWIADKISQKDIKIILVRTYCGHVLANYPNANYIYKKATCYDGVFPYALSCIRGRIHLSESNKLFIATMGFEEIKYTDLILNSSAKYAVPDNFKQLIQMLLDISPEKCIVDICQSNNMFNEFKNMYNKMIDFIENVKYMEEIINASIMYNNDEMQKPLNAKII